MDEITTFVRIMPVLWAFLIGLVVGLISLAGVVPATVVAFMLMLLAVWYYWFVLPGTSPSGRFGSLKRIERIQLISLVAVPWIGGTGIMWTWSSHSFWGMFLGSVFGVAAVQVALWKADFTWLTKRPEVVSSSFRATNLDAWARYHSEKWNFTMLYPGEWQILQEDTEAKPSEYAVIIGRKSRRGPAWFGFRLSPERDENVVLSGNDKLQYRDRDGATLVAAKKIAGGLWYDEEICTGIGLFAKDVHQMETRLFAPGLRFTFTCISYEQDWETLKPIFGLMLNSISMGPEAAPLTGQFLYYSTIVKEFGGTCRAPVGEWT